MIPEEVPAVLETPVTAAEISAQLEEARLALSGTPSNPFAFG